MVAGTAGMVRQALNDLTIGHVAAVATADHARQFRLKAAQLGNARAHVTQLTLRNTVGKTAIMGRVIRKRQQGDDIFQIKSQITRMADKPQPRDGLGIIKPAPRGGARWGVQQTAVFIKPDCRDFDPRRICGLSDCHIGHG